jgi:CRISPR-associated exonuclease Cas4
VALAPPDPAAEDALIPLSALQHYLFCPRQCALIHVEQLWVENGATADGRILHETVDSGRPERRPGVRILRGLALRSLALGVSGKADVVELTGKQAIPVPIEYKRGRPKAHRADEVQLCAQAICLEEAFGTKIPAGALFYGATRRRTDVAFDAELRALTAQIAAVEADIQRQERVRSGLEAEVPGLEARVGQRLLLRRRACLLLGGERVGVGEGGRGQRGARGRGSQRRVGAETSRGAEAPARATRLEHRSV